MMRIKHSLIFLAFFCCAIIACLYSFYLGQQNAKSKMLETSPDNYNKTIVKADSPESLAEKSKFSISFNTGEPYKRLPGKASASHFVLVLSSGGFLRDILSNEIDDSFLKSILADVSEEPVNIVISVEDMKNTSLATIWKLLHKMKSVSNPKTEIAITIYSS